MKSKSNLLNYISVLLSDDDALNTFLVDPITEAEGKYGITKAERAVLRRTVSHLSNKSKNGYTVKRHLGSYRRSLRLLQNVLHNVGTKMTAANKTKSRKVASDDDDNITVNLVIYYPPNITGDVDFTEYTNEMIQTEYGSPYTENDTTTSISVSSDDPTIKDVLDAADISYSLDDTDSYITEIKTSDGKLTADLTQYSLDDDYVFWFYSVNGQAGVGMNGTAGQSLDDYPVNDGDTVMWQLIAPDENYGFESCDTTDGAQYNK
jgi:hypothetical protein